MAIPINDTIVAALPVLAPVFESLHAVLQSLQWLVGGIFGLYVILIYLKWRESRMAARILKEIRDDIKQLSKDIRMVNEKVNKAKK